MLTNILNWVYILVTVFCLGYGFSVFSEKVLHYSLKRMDSILMAGIVMATVYAQIFSLFYRVNVEANVILLLICLGIGIFRYRQMGSFLKESFVNCSVLYKVVLLLSFLLWAYYTSRGYMVPDMDLYHGQSIRWIEEYGVVKGLGNLHHRFGYNSSFFSLSALYSMKFLTGRSMHTVNGLIAFLLSMEVLELGRVVKRRRLLLSDYARIGLLYYMSVVWDEILAPSSDYPVMFTIFFLVIKWLAVLEEEKRTDTKSITPYALLCVLGVQTLTLKVTAGLILILLIKPAYELLREKRFKEIAIYIVMGLLVALPWLIRNVIITGWLLYPFPALDLFDFDWKMTNIDQIKEDAALIKVYAKGHNDLGWYASVKEWFPNWFCNHLHSMQKVFVAADIVAAVCVAGIVIRYLIKKSREKSDIVLVLVTLLANYLFWQFSAPMMRYGYTHVLLLALLTFGYLLESMNQAVLLRLAYVVLALFVGYRSLMALDRIRRSWWLPNYVWQETYGKYELESYEMDGEVIYYSSYGGSELGYDFFPAVPIREDGIELRGEGLQDGFRIKGN